MANKGRSRMELATREMKDQKRAKKWDSILLHNNFHQRQSNAGIGLVLLDKLNQLDKSGVSFMSSHIHNRKQVQFPLHYSFTLQRKAV